MGAYNTVAATAACPGCNETVNIRVQFKYGATWQHEYCIGDDLRWGKNDVGTRGLRLVVVDGVAEGHCPLCGHDGDWDFYVHVERDRVLDAVPGSGLHDFVKAGSTYIELSR